MTILIYLFCVYFKDPQPPEPWEGIRDATKEGAICYQRDFLSFETQGSEDCLFLNVYTPQVNKIN